MLFNFWRRYRAGTPEYLARNYWWAYLSPPGVWFFDHDLIIDAILFGQYRTILDALMQRYVALPASRTLQLTCAYGSITPTLALSPNTRELHVMDVANIQLLAAQTKLSAVSRTAAIVRMNAEALAYADKSFDCVVIFFLLHELPVAARERTLREVLRVMKSGAHLLVAEYAENHGQHVLQRFTPWRWILEKLEPFLHDFWHSDLHARLFKLAEQQGIQLQVNAEITLFSGFYRVVEYRVTP
ncbi:MAG: class I SAM-dependent methyltransferase [Gallionellaceae bacterium]|jgi:ubiquinone/menaquinone biosynthesis C-methylase UbiE